MEGHRPVQRREFFGGKSLQGKICYRCGDLLEDFRHSKTKEKRVKKPKSKFKKRLRTSLDFLDWVTGG